MNSLGQCEYCGQELPQRAPGGFCPSCLLELAVAELPQIPTSKSKVQSQETSSQEPTAKAKAQRFGNYELLEKIGEGGMGVVYKARQVGLDRLVAVKLLPFGQFSREDFVQRFRAEATAAASLQHPNIVAIHEVGEYEGQHYFSMELVAGRTLGELVRDQPLSAKRAAAYLKAIAEAVHYAHQHGILHRDLKPSNILIDASDQPRITDFGLAKRLTDSQLSPANSSGPSPLVTRSRSELAGLNPQLTLTGQVLGSPNFMSPEQAEGRSRAIGPASDIYSLGALLYHLLTRQPPFQADTLTTLLKQVVETDPIPPRRLNPSIPRDLETVCLKCLEKEPSRRYAKSQELADDLARFLEDKPIHARPAGAADKAWKWCRRRPAMAFMAGALMLSVVLGLAGVVWQWRGAAENARQKEASEYAADMYSAQMALANNNRGPAVSLLDKYRPKAPGPSAISNRPSPDLRGWEWRYLWQLCRGDELFRLHQYPKPVKALALSKSGPILAVATYDQVALWDTEAKRHLTRLSMGTATTLAFSPVGNLLAVGTTNEAGQSVVDLWQVNPASVTKQRTLAAGNWSLAFSPDGKRLAMLNRRGTLSIADCASGQSIAEFPLPPLRYESAGAVVFLSDQDQLAIGTEYGRLHRLDLKTKSLAAFETPTGSCISALAYCSASNWLAAGFGYGDGTIWVWDADSRELRAQLTNHTDDVTALAFTADGQQLFSASGDRTIGVWDVVGQTQSRCLQSAREGVTALALMADNRTLISGGKGGSVCYWDTAGRSRPLVHTNLVVSLGLGAMSEIPPGRWAPDALDPKAAEPLAMAFTPDSSSFITVNTGGTLVQWDARSWQPVENLSALGSNHWAAALSPDGRWLATGDYPGKITLYDWSTRQPATNFAIPFEWFGLLRFSRSGHYFLASSADNAQRDHTIKIWRTGDWLEVSLTGRDFDGLWPVDLSPDDRLLAVGYLNGAIKLFRFPSLQPEATLAQNLGIVGAVIFSNDGRQLFSTDFGGAVRFWDVVARRQQGEPLRGHLGIIMGTALSPDGRRLATGGTNARDAVKLWDLEARREILSLQANGLYFTHIVFSPDGNTLAATGLSGDAHLWRAPSWQEIAAAEQNENQK